MKNRKQFLKKALALTLAFALLAAFIPQHSNPFTLQVFGTELPTLPQPGDLLRDSEVLAREGDGHGFTDLVNQHGVRRIVITQPEALAAINRFEVIIVGDVLEFYGTALLTFNTGRTSRSQDAVHEVFADGERLTFFVDHSLGTLAEMFVPFRVVAGTEDTRLYGAPVGTDGLPGSPGVSLLFLAETHAASPYRPTRVGIGSVLSVFTHQLGSTGLPIDRVGSSPSRLRTSPAPRPGSITATEFADLPDSPLQLGFTPLAPTELVTPTMPAAALSLIALTIGSTIYTVGGIPHQSDAAPFIADGRTMVPLRLVAEALGAEVGWIDASRTVTVNGNGANLALIIGTPLPGDMGTPVLSNGRTFVPLRFVAEALGAEVAWDSVTQTVTIVGR